MTQEARRRMELSVNVHRESGSYWADVAELPGCFATGDDLDELFASLREGVGLYLDDDASPAGRRSSDSFRITGAVLTDSVAP
jgi:predicted RNase H-like HicB family nuclease